MSGNSIVIDDADPMVVYQTPPDGEAWLHLNENNSVDYKLPNALFHTITQTNYSSLVANLTFRGKGDVFLFYQ